MIVARWPGMRIVILGVVGACLLIACGSSSVRSDGGADGGADGGVDGGGWGPCALAAAGHPNASTIEPRGIASSMGFGSFCDSDTRLFQSDAEYFAFESMRHPPDAGDAAADGAAMDAGNDAGLGVDWSRESLLVTISRGSGEYTVGVEGDTLVGAIGQL